MLQTMLDKAKTAQRGSIRSYGDQRNLVLRHMEDLIVREEDQILAANRRDVDQAESLGTQGAFLRRLALSHEKLGDLREGLRVVRNLPDPLGRGLGQRQLDNGLKIEQIRVPLGVIGLIFESRPGVAIEATGLAIKSGNALILRGGHEALGTNRVLVALWQRALREAGLSADLVQLIDSPERRFAEDLMRLNGLDLLIPRGGAGLIQNVVRHATVPVIETGVGNCHLYVDSQADLSMALRVLRDGKVGNPAVCNALETLLVHREIAEAFLPEAYRMLAEDGVIFHGDPQTRTVLPQSLPAEETDYRTEYLGLELAVKVVEDVNDAVRHIEQYGSGHSEAIVTDHYPTGQYFLESVDAAAVYWNASTRFTDGFQFGLGAEVGISTQKLHARGPMGIEALTTVKTLAFGSGQTRDL